MLALLADEIVNKKNQVCLAVQVGGLLVHVQNRLGAESNNQSQGGTAIWPIASAVIAGPRADLAVLAHLVPTLKPKQGGKGAVELLP